jgi:sugar lactone lactonase YvrE
MKTVRTEILAEGLAFPEGPRWRGDRLWFSDMYACCVYTLSLAGELERQVEVPGRPSGLGWTPSGELLVVSMTDRKLLRLNGGRLVEEADLSALTGGDCNDMVVTDDGTAFIGNFGSDIHNEPFRPTVLARVRPGAKPELAAEDMHFPNGAVIADQGRTLIIAETFRRCLTAFDLAPDGALSRRRCWADLGEFSPDGICRDSAGGIWVAAPLGKHIVRVEEGGKITHDIALSQDSYACAITDDGGVLLICTSAHTAPSACLQHRSGRIETIDLTAL